VVARPLDLLRASLDRIHDEMAGGHHGPPRDGEAAPEVEPIMEEVWDPDVAIYRHGDTVVIRADLPVTDKDHVHVDVGPDVVTISGELDPEAGPNEAGHCRSLRNPGTFYRSIPLVPGADAQHCHAKFEDGVLEVAFELPHDPKALRTSIEIE